MQAKQSLTGGRRGRRSFPATERPKHPSAWRARRDSGNPGRPAVVVPQDRRDRPDVKTGELQRAQRVMGQLERIADKKGSNWPTSPTPPAAATLRCKDQHRATTGPIRNAAAGSAWRSFRWSLGG